MYNKADLKYRNRRRERVYTVTSHHLHHHTSPTTLRLHPSTERLDLSGKRGRLDVRRHDLSHNGGASLEVVACSVDHSADVVVTLVHDYAVNTSGTT